MFKVRPSAINLCCVLTTGSGCTDTMKLCEMSTHKNFVSFSMIDVITVICFGSDWKFSSKFHKLTKKRRRTWSFGSGDCLSRSICQLDSVRNFQMLSANVSNLRKEKINKVAFGKKSWNKVAFEKPYLQPKMSFFRQNIFFSANASFPAKSRYIYILFTYLFFLNSLLLLLWLKLVQWTLPVVKWNSNLRMFLWFFPVEQLNSHQFVLRHFHHINGDVQYFHLENPKSTILSIEIIS